MGDAQMPRFMGVDKNVVGAFGAAQDPSSFQELRDEVFTRHGLIIHTIHTKYTGAKKPCS